jgi:hypothetical protein
LGDGLDQAADAFANEIAPAAPPRPRDDGGRFQATAKPETLFAERPVEGDPLTGDTSDGGADPRLAEHERRIADGRSEEGDGELAARSRRSAAEQTERRRGERLPAAEGGESPGHAGPDERHEGTETEPKEPGAQEPGDEGDEDSAWSLTHDGKPVEKLEIDVDGQTRQVTLHEMIRGYAAQESIQERARQVNEARELIQAEATNVGQARQDYLTRLEYMGRLFADVAPKEPNWDAEFAADPRAAREKQQVFNHVRGRMQHIAQEMQREQAERQQAEGRARELAARQEAAYAEWGKEEFRRRSGIADQATLANEYTAMRKAGLEVYGFNDHELGTVYDPRMLAVLHDASKYRRMMADKPRPVMPDKGRTLAPGAARPFNGSAARRGIDDALRKQTASGGSIDATTAVFQRLLR